MFWAMQICMSSPCQSRYRLIGTGPERLVPRVSAQDLLCATHDLFVQRQSASWQSMCLQRQARYPTPPDAACRKHFCAREEIGFTADD